MIKELVKVTVCIGEHSSHVEAYVSAQADEFGSYGYFNNLSCGMFGKRSAPIRRQKTAFGYEYRCCFS